MLTSGSAFTQGLFVMIVGMVIVFAALVLVMLATMALDRIFRPKPESPPVEKSAAAETADVMAEPAAAATPDQEIAAVISIALALRLRELEVANVVKPIRVLSVQDEPSLWAAVGKLG